MKINCSNRGDREVIDIWTNLGAAAFDEVVWISFP